MSVIPTPHPSCTIRHASPKDSTLIVDFMKELGTFQKMADKITATPKSIERLLESGGGEAVFISYDEVDIGFAYFYQKSSAFTGRSGLYLDALFIRHSQRGQGIGNIMMQFLAKHALSKGCEFLEWGCLDWNTPAIDFYQKQGAYCIDNMRIYRLSPDDLENQANLFQSQS
ncbi:GNAT family N-acetyltransferase [Marinomonas algarum]|uniref:GNAT family N-acetyltransferase n=1 Tax=Marinomonas algarum TaxID=2883105 RepID=A0A9X1IQ45_9GAMM|nr:GNAT family N-acetyltransferase [Marinomonas algarum]MCB5162396.1 GNAT family N-acetyltransferase [Marinomonas algarum]